MNDVLNDPLFSGKSNIEKKMDEQFGRMNSGLGRMNSGLRRMNSGLEKIDTKMDKMVTDIAPKLVELKEQLTGFQMTTIKMMRTVVEGVKVAPKFVYFVPSVPENKWTKFKPENWIGKKVDVMFLCPLTLEIPKKEDGKPFSYTLTLPKDWVRKYGPALIMSLRVLKVAFGLGRLAGLPLPVISDVPDKIKSNVKEGLNALTSIYDTLKEEKDLASEIECIEKHVSDSIPSVEDFNKTVDGIDKTVEVSNKPKELTTRSYEAVKNKWKSSKAYSYIQRR